MRQLISAVFAIFSDCVRARVVCPQDWSVQLSYSPICVLAEFTSLPRRVSVQSILPADRTPRVVVRRSIADPADKPHLRHNAVCLETQHFPDAVNHKDWAGSVLLGPGGTYLERAKHVFSADG